MTDHFTNTNSTTKVLAIGMLTVLLVAGSHGIVGQQQQFGIKGQQQQFGGAVMDKKTSWPKLEKIAALYSAKQHRLFVFNQPAMLKGIESGKFTVKWNGKTEIAAVRYPVSGEKASFKQDDKVSVVLGAKLGDVIKGTGGSGGGSIREVRTMFVYNCKTSEYLARLGNVMATRPTKQYPTLRSERQAFVHCKVLNQDGDDSGQMYESLISKLYFYSKADASSGFLGSADEDSSWVLSVSEWPNP